MDRELEDALYNAAILRRGQRVPGDGSVRNARHTVARFLEGCVELGEQGTSVAELLERLRD